MIRKLTLRAWYLFATVIVLFAVAQGIARYYIYHIPPRQIERNLSKWMGLPVKVNSINAGWYGFIPVIQLSDISITSKGEESDPIRVKQLSLGIDLWKSLLNEKFSPGLMQLEGADIHIVLSKDGKLSFPLTEGVSENLKLLDKNKLAGNLVNWLFKQDEVYFKDVSFDFDYGSYHRTLQLNSIKLVNDDVEHHLQATMQILQPDNASLTMIGNFKGKNYGELNGEFYVKANHIPLSLGAHNFFLQDVRVKEGVVDANAWGHLLNGRLNDVAASIRFSDILFLNERTLETRNVPYFNTTIFHKREKGLFETQSTFNFHSKKSNKDHELLFKKTSKGYLFKLSELHLQSLTSWYHFFDLPYNKEIENGDLEGEVNQLQLAYEDKMLSGLSFKFKRFGFHLKKTLRANNLTGQIYLNNKQGYLSLDSHNASVTFPKPYGKALTFNTLKGIYRWQQEEGGWRITGEKSELTNTNMHLKGDFVLDWFGSLSKSHLQMRSDYDVHRLDELRPYLPEEAIKSKLYHWIIDAFSSVPKLKGDMTINGILGDFPYSNKTGQFEITADAILPEFKFNPDWPSATGVVAHVEIKNDVLKTSLVKAMLGKNKMNGLQMIIKPLGQHKQNLYLQAKADLDAKEAVDYLFKTPLKQKVDILNEISLAGPIGLELGLTLPLYPENDNNSVRGAIKFKNTRLALCKECIFKLTDLKGSLFFDEDSILKSHLYADLWHEPLSITLSHQLKPKESLRINADGYMSIEKIRDNMPEPILTHIKGGFNYKVKVTLPEKGDRQLDFMTSLKGVSSALPFPFEKSKGSIKHLNLSSKSTRSEHAIYFEYDKRLKGYFNFKNENDSIKLAAGNIQIGPKKLSRTSRSGLALDISLKTFNLDKWKPILTSLGEKNKDSSLLSDINSINLKLNQLSIAGRMTKQFKLNAKKEKNAWKAQLTSQDFKGNFSVALTKKHNIVGNFDYLHLHKENHQAQSYSISPSQIPPLSFFIKNIDYDGTELGELTFRSDTENNNVVIDKLLLRSESYYLQLKGKWNQKNTALQGEWKSRDLGKSLTQWHFTPVIESNQTALDFHLNWPDDIFHFNFDKLNGSFYMGMRRGRITHLSKETERELALGKILSILSLQTIPRRLVLDFSDLTHKGLSFDTFDGEFLIKKGIVKTKKANLDGTIAYIDIHGAVNLIKSQYDLLLKVSPHISASLPVVVTLAGGPIAGAITWLTNKLMNQEMTRVVAYSYQVRGPWNKPQIEQLDITRKPKIVKVQN